MSDQYQSEQTTINVKESVEINYWCDEFNLKAEELVDIIKQVGPVVHDVRLFIAKKLIINWPVAY